MQAAILNNPPMKNHLFGVCGSSQIGKRDGLLSFARAHARKARMREGLETSLNRLHQFRYTILEWFWGAQERENEMKRQ